MDEISKLNEALQDKNNELNKVKHDYGSQISYINGLYIMDQYERLGDILKGIINGNESITDNLELLSNSGSVISVVINSLNLKNINIKNNGPKIEESIIEKIFEAGFTTKQSEENGFGLSIVKDLIEKNNGNLFVSSDDDCTEFKIIFKE